MKFIKLLVGVSSLFMAMNAHAYVKKQLMDPNFYKGGVLTTNSNSGDCAFQHKGDRQARTSGTIYAKKSPTESSPSIQSQGNR